MGITLALSAAIGGLKTAQKGLDLTSHNLSNINTEGYTRKIYRQNSRVIDGIGMGSEAGQYTRSIDEGLVRNIQRENGTYEHLKVTDSYLSRLEDMFGTPADNTSVSHLVNDMQIAFDQLSSDANNIATQSNAVEAAIRATEHINKLSDFIQNLRYEADRSLADAASEINSILKKIDTLNSEIVRTNNLGGHGAGDLKDQRDMAILSLHEKMDCITYERSNGEVVILTKSGRALLDQEASDIRHTSSTQTSAWLTYSGGTLDGFYAGRYDITNEIKSGELKGLIEMRDEILPELQGELDELAQKLMQNLNQVHNRGASFPDMVSKVEGTRTFIDDGQTINLSSGDVRITLFNQDGSQAHSTTLSRMNGGVGFASGAVYDSATHAGNVTAGTPDTLASHIEDWLKNDVGLTTATAKVNSEGKFEIDLGTINYGIAFRDEATTAIGSEHTDATIQFDADGDGTYDKDVQGFSNFFGLGDFFETPWKGWVNDSDIVSSKYNPNLAAAATINFSDETNGLQFGSITIQPGESLADIVNTINNETAIKDFVQAQLVKEGSGYRLRITHLNSEELAITENAGTNFLSNIGMEKSSAAISTEIKVKDEIANSASLVHSGAVQYDSLSGKYYMSPSDNTISSEINSLFSTPQAFEQAGYLGKGDHTFSEYSTSILNHMANTANQNDGLITYQKTLTENLAFKSSSESGVNMDEELSNLMMFEQAYAAAAKIIQATQNMLDILNSILN
ncbi:MAG: flagellar hook-associated protein FlgK [Alphaproteobacteria bacterium]|nr:flagellar hook-associated protein FlgK [Alphaproteobacteria bacterium]